MPLFSDRSILGKMKTTPQISEALEKVHANALLNLPCKYKKWYVTKTMRTVVGAQAKGGLLLEVI